MKHKTLLMVQVLLALAVGVWLPAVAADPTWLPEFNKSKHVYLDPHISQSRYPINLSGLDAELTSLQRKHHLEVYTIVTQQGDDWEYRNNSNGMKYAPWKLNQLARMWQGSPGYPMQDYLLVLTVRKSDDPDKFSVAANGGVRLQQYGLTAQKFSYQTGPVLAPFHSHIPYDVKGYFTSVVKGVNGEIDEYYAAIERAKQAQIEADKQAELNAIRAAEKAEADRIAAIKRAEQERIDAARRAKEAEEFRKALPGLLWKAFLILTALGSAVTAYILNERYKAEKAAEGKHAEEWDKTWTNIAQWYLELDKEYFEFLKDSNSRSKQFKGVTLETYTTHLKGYALFNAMYLELEARKDAAKRCAAQESFTNWATCRSLRDAKKLRTTEKIIVTGEKIPLEKANILEGLVKETPYTPAQLFTEISDLFDKTNKGLGAIQKSFTASEENKNDINNLLVDIEGRKTHLSASSLVFAPYEARLAEILAGQAGLLEILKSDPLTAFDLSEKVEGKARELVNDLDSAVARTKEIERAGNEIDKAIRRINEVRSTIAQYLYPLAGNEEKPLHSIAAFRLEEKDGNPDSYIESANKHLGAAMGALLAGNFAANTKEKLAAIEDAHKAINTIDAVLAAKEFVEKHVSNVRIDRDKLASDIPDAQKAVSVLKDEFLEDNFLKFKKVDGKVTYVREPEKLSHAEELLSSTDAELAKVKKNYDQQDYLAARQKLETLGGGIHDASDSLVEIHTCLSKLRQQRKYCRDVVDACEQRASVLKAKLTKNSFTTPKSVDDQFAQLQTLLSRHKDLVSNKIADWPQTVSSVDKLQGDFKAVDKQIDEFAALYSSAKDAFAAAKSAVEKARRKVVGTDIRTPAKSAFAEATKLCTKVEAKIQVAKSTWEELRILSSKAKAQADQALQLAATDATNAGKARAAIAEAQKKIASAKHNYRHNVKADLSSANQKLASIDQLMVVLEYERALDVATSAHAAAEAAEKAANKKVKAIDDDIAEEAARSYSSYSSPSSYDSGFSGGGFSGGGDGGGGWSGGGGDF